MKAKEYRKKPVVIEAVQWTGENMGDILGFFGGAALREGQDIIIGTLEGEMRAVPGDWIIRGVKGEHYPIKDEIFRETYEPTSQPAPTADDLIRSSVVEPARSILAAEEHAEKAIPFPRLRQRLFDAEAKLAALAASQPAPALDVTGAASNSHQADLLTAGAQQEPVAWLHRWHDGNPAGIYEFKAHAPPGVVVTPLYAAPQPLTVQDAARVLLDAVKGALDPFDCSVLEIEAMAVKHAGNRGDAVIQLEIAEEFFKAALRAIAEGRA